MVLEEVGGYHHPAAALSREKPGTHCAGIWVGFGAGLDSR
jgi:hypothetical protein